MTEITLRTKTTGVRKSLFVLPARGFIQGNPGNPASSKKDTCFVNLHGTASAASYPFKTNLQATKHCNTNTYKYPWMSRSYKTPIFCLWPHSLLAQKFATCSFRVSFHASPTCKDGNSLDASRFQDWCWCLKQPGTSVEALSSTPLGEKMAATPGNGEWILGVPSRNGACLKLRPHGPLVIAGYSKSSYCMINNKWGVPNFEAHTHTHITTGTYKIPSCLQRKRYLFSSNICM